MRGLEKFAGYLIVLAIAVVMLASVLPLVFPYFLCVFVLALIGRCVWFYTR